MFEIDKKDLKAFDKAMNRLMKIDEGNINHARGESFRSNAVMHMKIDGLGLKRNTSATRKIQGKSHPPEYNTGRLASDMKTKKKGMIAESGYFSSDSSQAGNISYATIANLQQTGFRIPLTGEKGKRVRGFLAAHGIFPKKTRAFLIVKHRPFFDNAVSLHDQRNNDIDTAFREFDKRTWKNV